MTTPAAIDQELDSLNLYALRALYRYAAFALADPHIDAWEEISRHGEQQLVAAAADLLREDPAASAAELGWGEQPLAQLDPQAFFRSLPETPDQWNAAYEDLFGLLVSSSCPPYETEYIDSKLSFQRAQSMADIAGFYRAFGWKPSTQRPERPDHLALELEFMATLCGMQTRALGTDAQNEQTAVCQDAQAKFLTEHLLWWTPAFAKLVAHTAPASPHARLVTLITALLTAHRALLHLPPHSGPQRATQVEPPEECEGCLVQPGLLG